MIKRFLTAMLLAVAVVGAKANDAPDSGATGLVEGTLSNGLKYYIMPNDKPAGSADFFLVQRAGSVFERDDQRGLAHFLEHMCFNGTEHFPGNSLISYLESVGVKFGANLNAYTSTDETVYNISKVPTKRVSTVDSCLLILRDWSCALTLDPKDIDAERGVIVNEWRHRNSATNRMLEKALPRIYPGSIYGERMPIGKMEIVENFKPKALHDFYHKWYHPGNQAVIVVGDVDVEATKKEIEQLFSGIKPGKNLITELPEVVPNKEMIVEYETDPEQGVNMVQLYFRHPKYSDPLAADLATTMLASRFDEVELSDDCPHTYLGVGDVKFLLSRGVDALVMRGVAKPGHVEDAAALWITELTRAMQHGFSNEEVDYAKAQMRKNLNDKIRKSASENNTAIARGLTRSFLDRKPYVSSAKDASDDLARLDNLTADDAMNYLNAVVNLNGENMVVLCYLPGNTDNPTTIDTEKMKSNLMTIAHTDQDVFKPVTVDRPLLTDEPTRGTIVKKEPYHFPNTTQYTLSNGIRVIAWPNDSVKDQIYIRGIGEGGLGQRYTAELAPTMKLINEMVAASGFGGFSNLELKRVLADKDVAVSINVKNTEEIVEASTTPAGLEDAFRLIYIKSTALQPDEKSFATMMTTERNKLRNVGTNPIQVMGDSIHRCVYNHHLLGLKNTPATLDAVDYAKGLDIVRDRFADMSDFTFYITGDFDTDSIEDLMARYIAPLPTGGRFEKSKEIDYRFTPGNHDIRFKRKMQNPVSVVYNFYHGPSEYNLENVLAVNIFNQILKMRLLADLREEKGWTYSIQGHGALTVDMDGNYSPMLMMPVYIKTEPGHEQETADIVNSTIEKMLSEGVTPEELDKAKQYMAKNHKENAADNAYLLSVLKVFDRYGKDMHTSYLEVLDQLKDISTPLRPITTNRSLLIMQPDESDSK